MISTLSDLTSLCQTRLESLFQVYLVHPRSPSVQLQQAMTYSVKNGGKRIRPLLVYAVGQLFDTPWGSLDAAACAIELIHSYSLIHDDLPAMDNADLRRGQPTCHKAYDEATAILAGDALQPLAFEIIASHPCNLTPKQRLEMIKILGTASGMKGMAAGQACDLAGAHSIEALDELYLLKTGALLLASVQLGIIASDIHDTAITLSLENFITQIAFAFQIQDDLLDIQGDSSITGKPQGIDNTNKKTTYPHILGVEKTQSVIEAHFQSALDSIISLGKKGATLGEMAHYLLQRKN